MNLIGLSVFNVQRVDIKKGKRCVCGAGKVDVERDRRLRESAGDPAQIFWDVLGGGGGFQCGWFELLGGLSRRVKRRVEGN